MQSFPPSSRPSKTVHEANYTKKARNTRHISFTYCALPPKPSQVLLHQTRRHLIYLHIKAPLQTVIVRQVHGHVGEDGTDLVAIGQIELQQEAAQLLRETQRDDGILEIYLVQLKGIAETNTQDKSCLAERESRNLLLVPAWVSSLIAT